MHYTTLNHYQPKYLLLKRKYLNVEIWKHFENLAEVFGELRLAIQLKSAENDILGISQNFQNIQFLELLFLSHSFLMHSFSTP